MRLRQVALVAEELGPAVNDLIAVLGIEVGFNDPGVKKYGLENAVIPIGDTFLEVVAPVQAGTTAGRLLDKRGGNGGYMIILQVDDIHAARARAEECKVRVVDRFDGDGAWFTHLHPRDVGAAILSLDAMEPPDRWDWAGPEWKRHVQAATTSAIVGAEMQGADPEALANRWGEVLGQPVAKAADGWHIALDGAGLRFVPDRDGRGEGVGGVDVAVRDGAAVMAAARARGLPVAEDRVTICGTRFRLV